VGRIFDAVARRSAGALALIREGTSPGEDPSLRGDPSLGKDTSIPGAAGRIVPHRTVLRNDVPNAFGTYHDLVRASGSTTYRLGDTFESAVTAYSFPRCTLFDRQLVGVEHRRDPAQIRRDGFEHFHLQVLRSGRMAGGPLGEERTLAPGDALLFDATVPQRTLVADADYVTVTLSRACLDAVLPDARGLHGRILPRDSGPLGAAVLSLARQASGLGVDPGADSALMFADLLASFVGSTRLTGQGRIDEAEIDRSRRLRAELFIDANLGRQDLDVEAVARGIGLSRSALYRTFQRSGGIERAIIRRRVARFRSALLTPYEGRPMKVMAYDFGFASLSHCSRVFKDFYGVAPNRLRGELRGAAGTNAQALRVDRMDAWYRDLNVSPPVSA
jgi:AraC-like DNA-binding protein